MPDPCASAPPPVGPLLLTLAASPPASSPATPGHYPTIASPLWRPVCVKQAYWQLPEVVGTRADVPFLSSWQLALTAHTHSPAALSTPAVPHRPADDSLLWANDADLVWEAVPTVDGESENKGKSGPGAGRG